MTNSLPTTTSTTSRQVLLPTPALNLYPPVTHTLSPTWFAWVKLTTFEIHNVLKPVPAKFATLSYASHPDAQPPKLYHYLNHPIQYVYISGVVIENNEFNERYYIFIIDDSSGETIEVVYPRPPGAVSDLNGKVRNGLQSHAKLDAATIEIHQTLANIDVGSVLKIKGHITTFRSYRQLRLDRVKVLRDTNEEVSFWASRHAFYSTVLSTPWHLSEEELQRARDIARQHGGIEAKMERRRQRQRLRARIEEKGRLRLEARWQEEEKLRALAADEARAAGRVLMSSMQAKPEPDQVVN